MQKRPNSDQRKPILNLIAWDNGVGLSRDLRLLDRALRRAGFEVHITAIGRGKLRKWSRPLRLRIAYWLHRLKRRPLFDANIMLEHLRPEDFPFSARTLFVPNPEWCLPADVALLPQACAILAKTHHAEKIFGGIGCRVAYIGFTSEDRLDPNVERQRTFFHLAGRSSNKGTSQLMALWLKHPEWPTLTVIQSPREADSTQRVANNMTHRVDYVDEAELKELQNRNWFHLCPSETEGFGHYLVEAMSVGAVAITTNAPPMNEIVSTERGVLVDFKGTGKQHMSDTFYFDDSAMESAISRVIAMSDSQLKLMGSKARDWFVVNDETFSQRLQSAIVPLLSLPKKLR